MQQRKINEELIEVWKQIIQNNMKKLEKQFQNLKYSSPECQRLIGRWEAYSESIITLNLLKKGGFHELYENTLKQINERKCEE